MTPTKMQTKAALETSLTRLFKRLEAQTAHFTGTLKLHFTKDGGEPGLSYFKRAAPASSHEAISRQEADTRLLAAFKEFAGALYECHPVYAELGKDLTLDIEAASGTSGIRVTPIFLYWSPLQTHRAPAALINELSGFAALMRGYEPGPDYYQIEQNSYPGKTPADALQLWAALNDRGKLLYRAGAQHEVIPSIYLPVDEHAAYQTLLGRL